jgi:hypothetical protein
VTRRAEPTRRQPTPWRRILGGVVTAVLLLPVPVFALTWAPGSTWTGTDSTGTVGPTADPLTFTPPAGKDVTINMQRDFFPAGGNPSLSANVLIAATGLQLQGGTSGTETMTLRIWTTFPSTPDNDVIPTVTITSSSNQFVNGNDQSGNGAPLQSGLITPYTVHVQFSLAHTGTGTWSMPSSTTTIVANIFD